MATTVTLNWLNKSQNLTGQRIYFGDENSQTLLADIGPALTTYQHVLPPEITGGIVHYRVASYVTTTDQGDVEESTTAISVNLDTNVGLIFHTEETGYQIVSLTPFTVHFSDGSVINSGPVEMQPGLNVQMINTTAAAGRTRIVPVTGNQFELLNIATRVDAFESWGGYEFVGAPAITPIPFSFNKQYLVGVPANAPNCDILAQFFYGASLFNDPNVLTWDVSNVTNMDTMFRDAAIFNQPIGVWNVSSVTNFSNMFNGAANFNQNLTLWCLANITDPNTQMVDTFINMPAMNEAFKPIAGTCPRGEIDYVTLSGASKYLGVGESFTISYNTNLDDTGRVWSVSDPAIATITDGLLQGVTEGTVTVSLTIGAITKTVEVIVKVRNSPFIMTKGAGSSVISLELQLDSREQYSVMVDYGDGSPEQELVLIQGSINTVSLYRNYPDTTERTIAIYSPWEPLPNVEIITGVTAVTSWPEDGWTGMALGPDIVSVPSSIPTEVTNLSRMFNGSGTFNQNISTWNVSNITNMYNMFYNASTFNQDISGWNTGKVTNMQSMFYNATVFDQDLSQWCVYSVLNNDFGTGSALQPAHYPVWGTCPRNEVPAP